MTQSARIVGGCILAAVCYGIAHDQITARVCVEYFTIGHPVIFPTDSPTMLGLIWGIIATWWVGLALGILLALAARSGSRPKMTAQDLRRPVMRLLLVMATSAFVAGVVGGALAASGAVWLVEPMASRVPAARHVAFLAVMWAHLASYAVGALGGLTLCVQVWRVRGVASGSSAST